MTDPSIGATLLAGSIGTREARMMNRALKAGRHYIAIAAMVSVAAAVTASSGAVAQFATGGAGAPHIQHPDRHPSDCTCRAKGRDFHVGETVCLRTAEGPRLAACDMELNNTSWRFSGQGCPES